MTSREALKMAIGLEMGDSNTNLVSSKVWISRSRSRSRIYLDLDLKSRSRSKDLGWSRRLESIDLVVVGNSEKEPLFFFYIWN